MKEKLILSGIILLAVFLRVYQLDNNPPGFYSDEASWAYNAYSIMLTGRDEYGRLLPWSFEAFGDYKLPVTVYSIVPSYWLFGISDWSARLPTAIYGVLSILAIYFLTKELVNFSNASEKLSTKSLQSSTLPIVSASILTITPAHIFLSRGIWDIQPALFFLTIGVAFFIKAVNTIHQKLNVLQATVYFSFSAIAFVVSMYAYNSARVIAPLIVFLLAIGYRKSLWNYLRPFSSNKTFSVVIPIIIGIFLLLPQLSALTDPEVTQRARYVSIFNRGDVESKIFGATAADGPDHPVWFIRLLHNKPVFYASEIAQRYLQHFNPNYLFLTGDTFEIFKVEGIGVLLLATLPVFFMGLVYLFVKRPTYWWLLIGWLFIAPIPSSLTIFTPSVSRAHNMIIPLTIITAYGTLTLFKYLSQSQVVNKYILAVCLFSAVVLNLVYWYAQYFILTPAKIAFKWGDGWSEVAQYVLQNQHEYTQVLISNTQGPSYIWLAWYQRLSPQYVWSTRSTDFTPDSNGLNTTSKLGNYIFTRNIANDCFTYTHAVPTICIGYSGEIGGRSTKIMSSDHNLMFEILSK